MIKINGLWAAAGKFMLKDINLEIKEGDYFMLVGPTGSGKTVLLETITGVRKIQQGTIQIGERVINTLEPEKREVSLVYQDCALFPHLSVAENIVFGLKVRRESHGRVRAELERISDILKVSHLLERKPATLSGGERHKVALARSLIVRPRLLLLDEPLSALDPLNREGLQQELRLIHSRLGITVIHVTHDFEEAMTLGKHIAVIDQGEIRQAGTPEQVFRQPASELVARFIQMRNVFPGKLDYIKDGSGIFQTEGIGMVVPRNDNRVSHACIRPEEIAVSTKPFSESVRNSYSGKITAIVDKGPLLQLTVNLPPEFVCLITRREMIEMRLEAGQTVNIAFNPESIHLF
jgi:ABC-type Fe3+/spermidine/putrescine transport system ATPase subunit